MGKEENKFIGKKQIRGEVRLKKNQFRSHPFFGRVQTRNKLTPHQVICYRNWQEFDVEYDVTKHVPDAIADRLNFTRPEPPKDPREIYGWKLDVYKQKFPYYTKEEKSKWESYMDETHVNHNLYLEFITEEWRRRREGFWFFNGGHLEYITGHHYMFLQYWLIPVEKNGRNITDNPQFRDVNRTVFYALEAAKNDKRCYGLLYYAGRRSSKTAIALSYGFFDTTAHRDQRMTVQSKNEKDGKIVFGKLVDSWKKIPAFFKPADEGDTAPKSKISFEEEKRKGSVTEREYSDAFINSSIQWDGASETALDGRPFSYIFTDEVGKVDKGLDVNERWNINKECLAVGTKIIGFSYVTSTIEDFEKFAAREAQILWERSDPVNSVDPILGRTDSGLYRLFLPAYYGYQGDGKDGEAFVDEWGYSNIEKSYQYIRSQYDFKKGDALLSFRRKNPITIEDSFALADSGNNFSKEKIYQQQHYNKGLSSNPVRRGNFIWEKGVKDSNVVFMPDEKGRWELSWIPKETDRNKWSMKGNQRFPTRDFGRMGVDPFDQSQTVAKGSDAAAITVVNHPEVGNGAVVCVYRHRQEYSENFFEDMILQSVFFSTPTLVENNKSGVIEHFRRRGYFGYLLKDPLEKDPKKRALPKRGISTTGDAKIQEMIDNTQAFIYDHIGLNEKTGEYGWCPHDELLKDWLRFEPTKRTKYDLTMASLMVTTAFRNQQQEIQTRRFESIADWFPKFK